MITEKEICLAIEECLTEPATATKVSRLADLLIIQEHLFGGAIDERYSEAKNAENQTIKTNSGSEFLASVNGKDFQKVIVVLDELMETIKALHPRMHDQILDRLDAI